MAHQWEGQVEWGAEQQIHPADVLSASVTTKGTETLHDMKQASSSDVCLVQTFS